MSELEFNLIDDNYHILPTPAGAYYAASSSKDDPSRRLLFALMSQDSTQALDKNQLRMWTSQNEEQDALEILYRIQQLGWVTASAEAQDAPVGTMQEALPDILEKLSGSERALLSDHEGFYLAANGFSHETAEELSALSADIASLHSRHSGLLHSNLGLSSAAWAIVDASANGHLGFWPLYIGTERFVLVLAGIPQFNQEAYVELIWLLSKRYANAQL